MLNATVAGGSVRLKKPGFSNAKPGPKTSCSPDEIHFNAPGAQGATPPRMANASFGSPNVTQFATPKQLMTMSSSYRSWKFCPNASTRSLFELLSLVAVAPVTALLAESYTWVPKFVVIDVNVQLSM